MLVFVMIIFILTGCIGQNQKQKQVKTQTTEKDIDKEGYVVVGVAQVGSESDWRNANTQSFKDTFTTENGYYLIFEDGQQKQENQVKAIRNFILQEVDYIILDPIVETGWEGVLQEAKAAGIPVILSDRCIAKEYKDMYTCWVGSDFKREGEIAGAWLASHLSEQNKINLLKEKKGKKSSSKDEKVNIVTIKGTPDSSAQIGRTAGFESFLKKYPNWKMLDSVSGEFTQAKAKEVMGCFLQEYKDIDVVVCENDNMAFGAIEAIEQYGKKVDVENGIKIISFDAIGDAFEYMKEGKIAVDIECNPLTATKIEEVIKRLEKNKKVPKVNYVNETFFDYKMDLDYLKKNRVY